MGARRQDRAAVHARRAVAPWRSGGATFDLGPPGSATSRHRSGAVSRETLHAPLPHPRPLAPSPSAATPCSGPTRPPDPAIRASPARRSGWVGIRRGRTQPRETVRTTVPPPLRLAVAPLPAPAPRAPHPDARPERPAIPVSRGAHPPPAPSHTPSLPVDPFADPPPAPRDYAFPAWTLRRRTSRTRFWRSAGETPGTRPAWASVDGLTRPSFWRASTERVVRSS